MRCWPRRGTLERDILLPYLAKRRWFAMKDQTLKAVRLTRSLPLPEADGSSCWRRSKPRRTGASARWLLPLAIVWEERADRTAAGAACAGAGAARRAGRPADGCVLAAEFANAALAGCAGSAIDTPAGEIRFEPTSRMAEIVVPPDAEMKWLSVGAVELLDDRRRRGDAEAVPPRLRRGRIPEAEMGRYLTEQGFANIAPLLGEIVRVDADGERHALAVAQGFIRNQGDAWTWTLDLLMRGLAELTAGTEAAQATEAEQHEDYECDCSAAGPTTGRDACGAGARYRRSGVRAGARRGAMIAAQWAEQARAAAGRGVRRA